MLLNSLLENVHRHPEKAAVCDERMTLSYGQLAAVAAYVARLIQGRTQQARVGIMLPACAAFAPVFFGTRWAHRTAVPLNFLLQPSDLQEIVKDAGFDLLITIRHFEKLATALPCGPVYIDDELARLARLKKWLGWLPRFLQPRQPPVPRFEPDELAALLYTSGTSGQPKGVMLSEKNLSSNARECIERARMDPDGAFLSCLPKFHSFGLTALLLAPMMVGATGHFHPRFNASAVAKTIRDLRITVFMAVPSMWNAMLRLKSVPADNFSSLKLAISGGEGLPVTVRDGYRERFNLDILEGYGLTETSPVVALNLPWANKPGTVGKPLASWQCRIIPDHGDQREISDHVPSLEALSPAPPGEIGELWLKGPCLTSGYLNKPELTRQAFSADGWFRTGDYCSIDSDGYLAIRGRKKEMLIIAGENVFPAEIEQVLAQHPAVAQVAVVGAMDPIRGETPIAFVVPQEDAELSAADLRDFARDRLAAYKLPGKYVIEADLPKGPTGKLLKRELRSRL